MPITDDLSKLARSANGIYNSVTANATAITTLSVGGATINATSFGGTANNANNLGGLSLTTVQGQITGNAATAYSNAVANAASLYQTTAGLSANVATLAANSSSYANASVTNTFTVGTAAYFVANGNVGIGTSSPGVKFDLAGDYKEGVVTANTSTAYTISLASGTLQILTLTGSCTFTFPTATAGQSFMMFLKQDATGSRTVTWPASVKWPSSTAPTITATASKGDKFVFTADGTNWLGSVAGQNYL